MTFARVIPVIQIHRDEAVKTISFKPKHYIGDPVNSVRLFSDKCADEVMVIDIGASRGEYPLQVELLSRMTAEAFMPFGYGGGIKSAADASRIFSLGVEKVIVRWRGEQTGRLVRSIAESWGSQAVSVAVDYFDRRPFSLKTAPLISRKDVSSQIRAIEESGAGEIILQSVDRDGSMGGLYLELLAEVSTISSVQLVALGGAESLRGLSLGLNSGASAVAAASLFLFRDSNRAVLINYPSEMQLMSIINESSEES